MEISTIISRYEGETCAKQGAKSLLQHVNLSIPAELRRQAEEAEINLSKLLSEALKMELGKASSGELEGLLDRLKARIDQAGEIYQKAVRALEEAKNRAVARNQAVRTKVQAIPELKDLNDEQLKDTTFLGELVDVVRKKHGIKVSISEVREVYER